MSFWFYRKDISGKRYAYSVTIPFEVIVLILGLLVGFLGPLEIWGHILNIDKSPATASLRIDDKERSSAKGQS